MAIHSSILAWEIPWAEKPSGLPSMGSQRVRHDLASINNNICLISLSTIPSRSSHVFANDKISPFHG